MIIIINIFLFILGLYVLIGSLFGLYFLFKGATIIDLLMKDTNKKMPILLVSGVIATWPFLIGRFFKSKAA